MSKLELEGHASVVADEDHLRTEDEGGAEVEGFKELCVAVLEKGEVFRFFGDGFEVHCSQELLGSFIEVEDGDVVFNLGHGVFLSRGLIIGAVELAKKIIGLVKNAKALLGVSQQDLRAFESL